MRSLSRAEAAAARLLNRARTIAVVGSSENQKGRTVTGYLRRAGYDVVAADPERRASPPGPVDLVLVFRAPDNVAPLLEYASSRQADGIWFTEEPAPATRGLARRLRMTLVYEPDVVKHHRERLREAGQPPKLDVRGRRRQRQDPVDGSLTPARGWNEAGGGGRRGGGGSRAVIDEKKMVKGPPGRRGRRRAMRSG